MLIACIIAFAILLVAWCILPSSVETAEVAKSADTTTGSITAS